MTEYLLGDEVLDGILRDVRIGGANHEGDRDLAGGVILLPAMRIHVQSERAIFLRCLVLVPKQLIGLTGRRLRRRWMGGR